jgi:hypothetical protein
MIDLDLESLDPEEVARLDAEWLAISALRDTLDVATKGNATPTYQAVLDIAERLAPELFSRERSMVKRLQTDAVVREYEQRAAAESRLKEKRVTAVEVVEREIAEYEKLLEATPGPRDQLVRRLRHLESIRARLIPERRPEGRLLLHDVCVAGRPGLPRIPGGGLGSSAFRRQGALCCEEQQPERTDRKAIRSGM